MSASDHHRSHRRAGDKCVTGKARRLAAVPFFVPLGLALTLCAWPRVATAVVIDGFSSSKQAFSSQGARQSRVGVLTLADGPGLTDVMGGGRQLNIVVTEADMPGLDAVSAALVPQTKVLGYSSSPGADGRVELIYDRLGKGLKAKLVGKQGISVTIADADAAAVPYRVSLTISDGAQSGTIGQTVKTPGKARVDFRLKDMRGVNLRAVRSITIAVDPGKAADLQIGEIRTFRGAAGR